MVKSCHPHTHKYMKWALKEIEAQATSSQTQTYQISVFLVVVDQLPNIMQHVPRPFVFAQLLLSKF